MRKYLMNLTEEERQLVLMGLAHLQIERPQWADAITAIALTLNNPGGMFYRFLDLDQTDLVPVP